MIIGIPDEPLNGPETNDHYSLQPSPSPTPVYLYDRKSNENEKKKVEKKEKYKNKLVFSGSVAKAKSS